MRKLLLLCAIMFSTIGAWAQETRIGEPITELTSGKYVLVCKSDKGVGPAYFEQSGNALHYRYDRNKSSVTSGSIIDNPNLYVWQVDVLQNGKITIKLANDHTKYFPKDNNKNQNFMGKEIAELTPEVKTIDGINYILLKYDDNIGYIHVNAPGGNPVFSYWPAGETSTTCVKFQFHPVGNLTYTLTDDAENQYTGRFSGTAGESIPSFTGVANLDLSNQAWEGNTFTANVSFPFPVSSEKVTNPTFISAYKYNQQDGDQFKWYASDNKIKVKEGEEIFSSSIASHLWLIYPKFYNGAFTFQIKNVATGLFINGSVNENGHDDASKVKLSNEATEFTIGVRNGEGHEFINSFGYRLSVNTSKPDPADKIQTVGTYDRSHYGTALTFPKPGFNVTIGATGYATLYSPITVLPEVGNQTLEIYQIVSAPKNNSVTLYQIHYVHKNQGVILKGNIETKYWFALTDWKSFTEEDWKNNKLKGSYVDTYVAGPAYVLANEENGVGLYKAKLNKDANGATGTTHFKNNAGKAYLPASPAASGARFLVFNFGDDMETGITETENGNVKTENTEVYDLSGRRVQGAQKGIFIVNGKKVVR